MKVIFIEDVTNVARAGQSRVVADGYARNYLFPRKLAVLADSRAAASVEAHLKKVARRRAIEEAEMAELAKLINGTEITIKAKVGESERLYGSVTGADIAGELGRKIGREVDKRKVDLAEPVRQVGVYDVTIRFTHEITAVVVVTVMSDEEGAVPPVRAEKPPEKEVKAEKPEKPKAEKKKKEKPPKEEPPAPEAAAEPPAEAAAEVKPEATEAKAEKKEKKAKKEEKKAEKEAEPAAEEKKEKKPRAERKAKKSEAPVEEAKE